MRACRPRSFQKTVAASAQDGLHLIASLPTPPLDVVVGLFNAVSFEARFRRRIVGAHSLSFM